MSTFDEALREKSIEEQREIIEKAQEDGYKYIAIKVTYKPSEMKNPAHAYEIRHKEFNSESEKDYFENEGYDVIRL